MKFLYCSAILPAAFAAATLFAAPLAASPPPPPPPVAPVRPVVDTYVGHKVVDPYQWMENLQAPEMVAWLKGQANYAKATLAAIPGRAKLLARIHSLDGSVTTYGEVNRIGRRLFYEKMRPQDETPELYVRDGLHGRERLLMDAMSLSHGKTPYAISYYAPSLDGKYVAVGISPGGSENSTIYVIDADTGKVLPDRIDRTRFGNPTWLPNDREFFYNRLPKLAPNASPLLSEEMSRVYLHVLGRNPNRDPAVFGYGLSPRTNSSIEPNAISFVSVSPVSPYAIGLVEHGVQNEITLYAAPIAKVTGPGAPWRKIVDVGDDVTSFDVRGSTIYLLTHKNAPRFKVVATSILHPDLAHAKVLVPPSRMVVKSVFVAKDALYTTSLDGGISRLRRVGFDGGPITQVHLPYDGNIAEVAGDPRLRGCWMLMTGWTESALWYAYNPSTGSVVDTGLKKKAPVDFSGIEALEVKARAKDGTMIPLSIICPKGTKLDGSHPTIIDAYGAYGISLLPGFNPTLLAWFDQGGIYAVAHVRGGGEYGHDWHVAGKLLNKPNTWNDLIACAQYMIAKGYTSPAKLAIEGGSAGGITVGRAMTERPDLFGVVLDEVGASDALRQQFSPNGPPNEPEFGDVNTPLGFKALYAMDAYQHVRNGVAYPAVLLTTGINDPRVAPWEPAKMAARLQAATSSGKPVLLRVDYEAGHGIGSDRSQSEQLQADLWSFALWQLGDPRFQPNFSVAVPDRHAQARSRASEPQTLLSAGP